MSRPGSALHLAHHLAAVGYLLAGAARYEAGRGRQLALVPSLVGDTQQHCIEACFPRIVIVIAVAIVIIVVAGAIALLAAAAGADVVVAAALTWRRW